jgi:hypothetical protein
MRIQILDYGLHGFVDQLFVVDTVHIKRIQGKNGGLDFSHRNYIILGL